jgi:hypothetical protein
MHSLIQSLSCRCRINQTRSMRFMRSVRWQGFGYMPSSHSYDFARLAGEYKASVCSGRARSDQVTCAKCIDTCPAGFYKDGNCDRGNRTSDIQCKPVGRCEWLYCVSSTIHASTGTCVAVLASLLKRSFIIQKPKYSCLHLGVCVCILSST